MFVQSACTSSKPHSTGSELPQPAASSDTVKVTKEYDFAGETIS